MPANVTTGVTNACGEREHDDVVQELPFNEVYGHVSSAAVPPEELAEPPLAELGCWPGNTPVT